MKSKILFSTLILFIYSFNAFGQTTDPVKPAMGTASFGFYGGVNFQNINGSHVDGSKLDNSLVTRFHGGINEQIPVAPEFFIQIGLQYTGKGTRGHVNYYNDPSEIREVSLHYVDMPINFLYKPLVGKGHFLLGFGPYVGYAFGGKAKFEGNSYTAEQNILFANDINESNPNDLVYFKHFDVGANAFFGYEFANRLNMVFNTQLGLVNINSKNSGISNSKLSEMNTGFGLSLGYRIN